MTRTQNAYTELAARILHADPFQRFLASEACGFRQPLSHVAYSIDRHMRTGARL